jgi:TIR domain
MFNVIVSSNTTAWETDQLMRITADRFMERGSSDNPEAARVSLKSPASLALVEGIPTLLFYEQCDPDPAADVIRYGTVHGVRRDGSDVVFRFTEEGRFSRATLAEFQDRLGISVNRTNWAVKEDGIPNGMMQHLIPTYDVVFSFAGANRSYVSAVADFLRARGVRVFYDEYEQDHLWGRDLVEHFSTVYGQSGRFCVMFISADYVESMWTRHERRTALERALMDPRDYILPARFDNTLVPGIRSTVHYMQLANRTPIELAQSILRRLGRPVS